MLPPCVPQYLPRIDMWLGRGRASYSCLIPMLDAFVTGLLSPLSLQETLHKNVRSS